MARRRIKRKGDSLLRDGLILLAVAVVFVLLLAGVVSKTKKPIDDASKAAKLTGYQNAFKDYGEITIKEPEGFEPVVYEDRTMINDMAEVYLASGEQVGYAFISKAQGYSTDTDITLSVGLDMDGVITGVDVVSMNETSGIGSHCTDEEFKEQFKGHSGSISLSDEGIDAISNATFTSEGVVNAINICLDYYNEHLK